MRRDPEGREFEFDAMGEVTQTVKIAEDEDFELRVPKLYPHLVVTTVHTNTPQPRLRKTVAKTVGCIYSTYRLLQ